MLVLYTFIKKTSLPISSRDECYENKKEHDYYTNKAFIKKIPIPCPVDISNTFLCQNLIGKFLFIYQQQNYINNKKLIIN